MSTVSPKNSSSFSLFYTSAIMFITCRNRHRMKNHIMYKGNINNASVIIFLIGTLLIFLMDFSLDQVYYLDYFCKLNKTPGDGTCLGELPGGFCDVGCCCCFLRQLSFLRFQANFSCHRHYTMASQAREGLHQLYPGYFRLIYFCQALNGHFERVLFTLRRFLPCTLSPHF